MPTDVVRVGGTTFTGILLDSCSSGRSGSAFVIVYLLDALAELGRLAVDALEEIELVVLVVVGLPVVESIW